MAPSYTLFAKILKLDYVSGMIAKTVSKQSLVNGDSVHDEPVGPVDQYKEVIRVQDNKIKELGGENESLREQVTQYAADSEKLRQLMYELQQENTEMKLRVSSSHQPKSYGGTSTPAKMWC